MLVRFDVVERAVHWAIAVLFIVLVLTALALYFPSVTSIVGRRSLVAEIHLWCGIALPFPLIAAFAGSWGSRLRADVRRFNVWTRDEVRWLRRLGSLDEVRLDKFNPGQKLNAIFTAGVIVVMLASGLVMHFIHVFPLDWRTGATFVHDVVFFVATVVIVGHIGFALTHPSAMRSIVRGSISQAWARRHAPRWLDDEPESASR